MTNDTTHSITEIKNGKVLGSWTAESLDKARADVATLKISGRGKTFSIENKSGTVVDVIKVPGPPRKTLHFHDFASKKAFIVRNGIAPEEILAETDGSITIETDESFENSALVYRVS